MMNVLRVLGRSYRLRSWHESPSEGAQPASFAASLVRSALGDPSAVWTLRRVLSELEPVEVVDDWELRRRIELAIERGTLRVDLLPEAPRPWMPGPKREEEEIEPAPEPDVDWIEIELVDSAGKPVPSQRFEVILGNGRRRSGTLDESGWARVEGLPPGACKVTFPGWDARSWRAA